MEQCNENMYKVINYGDVTGENKTIHNLNWPYIPDHPFRILIIGGSGSRNRNALLNLIKHKDNDDSAIIDKIYLYVKNPNEAKYLIRKREKIGLDHHEDL